MLFLLTSLVFRLELVVDSWIENLWASLEQNVVFDSKTAAKFAATLGDGKFTVKNIPKKEGASEPATSATKSNTGNKDGTKAIRKSSDANEFKSQENGTPVASSEAKPSDHAVDSVMDQGAGLLTFVPPPTSTSVSTPLPSINSPSMLFIDIKKLAGTTQLSNVPKLAPFTLNVEATGRRRTSLESIDGYYAETRESISLEYSASNPFLAPISKVRTLTGPKALKKVLEITLDIQRLNWKYQSGDSFGLLCPNPDELVYNLLNRLNLEKDHTFEVSSHISLLPFSSRIPLTYYEAIKYHLDLHVLPRKSFFRMLAETTSDDAERNTLFFLASTQGTLMTLLLE